jgi:hypothetical protein|nr:MAG TPA: hypothetical protein [Caudoviricetes sp.]
MKDTKRIKAAEYVRTFEPVAIKMLASNNEYVKVKGQELMDLVNKHKALLS